MTKESVLAHIMVDDVEEVFLSAEKDFPVGESRLYRIIDGKYVNVYFNNKKLVCSSNDMIVGRRTDGVKQKCETCTDKDVCTTSCRLILTNLSYGHVYYLNIPHLAQVSLSHYVEGLLLNDLDAPDVITRIMRVKNGKFTAYTFELVDKWFTEEELNTIMPIIKSYLFASDDDKEDFDIPMMLKLSGIDEKRSEIIQLLMGYKHG